MPRQSRPLPVLLTRPAAQGDRFATALRARFGERLRIVVAPLLAPRFLDGQIPDGRFAAVIFTSETGVAAAVPHAAELPRDAWCVGDRTAQAAEAAGFRARSAGGDAADLVRCIAASRPSASLLHLRGQDSRGDVAAILSASGFPTRDHVTYEQEAQPLSAEAATLLSGTVPVTAAVFSPRTAMVLSSERERLALPAPLRLVALSPAVAAMFARRPGDEDWVARGPTAIAMIDAMADALGMA